jgi:hypothetical protein
MDVVSRNNNHFALKRELRGTLYREVLQYALKVCSEGVLLIRPYYSCSESARKVLERLSAFPSPDKESLPWTGAQLFDSGAEVKRFLYCQETVDILLEVSKKIFDWEQPGLPEDLTLIRPDGSDWLVAMSHSRQAFLSLSREERSDIVHAIPRLGAMIQ